MARTVPRISLIYGIDGSWRDCQPYNDLSEVLNKIGVMAKRTKVPYAQVIIPPSKIKEYSYIGINEYRVPSNWRDCLYEDLETGHYFIVSPSPDNDIDSPDMYSWIAFRITGLFDGIRWYSVDETTKRGVREILHHTGTFIDLLRRCNLNEVLDTLAETQKPIIITTRRLWNQTTDREVCISNFDI